MMGAELEIDDLVEFIAREHTGARLDRPRLLVVRARVRARSASLVVIETMDGARFALDLQRVRKVRPARQLVR